MQALTLTHIFLKGHLPPPPHPKKPQSDHALQDHKLSVELPFIVHCNVRNGRQLWTSERDFILLLVHMHSPHEDFRWGQHAGRPRHDLDLHVPPYRVVGAPDSNPLTIGSDPREMTAQVHVVNSVSHSSIKVM